MIYVGQHIVRSHLDPRGGPLLAAWEERRLTRWLKWCRDNREPVLFLTFTYNPERYRGADDPETAEAIYDDAIQSKHIAVTMGRIGVACGIDLKGKWRAKVEFQKSGNLHYHVLVRGLAFVKHETLMDAWGHGHVWVERAKLKHAGYVAKYQGKAGAHYPEFLYDRPPRSVKIWGTSPGFWNVLDDGEPDEERKMRAALSFLGRKRKTVLEVAGSSVREVDDTLAAPSTVREAIHRSSKTTVCDCEDRRVKIYGVDSATMAIVFVKVFRLTHVKTEYGIMQFDGSYRHVVMAVKQAALLTAEMEKAGLLDLGGEEPYAWAPRACAVEESGRAGGPACLHAGQRPALHLIQATSSLDSTESTRSNKQRQWHLYRPPPDEMGAA